MADAPKARYGASSCVDEEGEAFHVLWGSSAGRNRRGEGSYNMDCLWSYDYNDRSWRRREWRSQCEADKSDMDGNSPPVEVGACCTMLDGKMYCFGSWMLGECTASVFELDMENMTWQTLVPETNDNLPLLKNKAGMVAYGSEMLLVFGGYGYPMMGQPLQPGASYATEDDRLTLGWPVFGWTNEMHLFHIKEKAWIVPQTTGTRPPPCAAFSINKIDSHRVAVFGGRQREGRVSELHILDMADWHWSGAITPTNPLDPWPPARSFHTACCLVDPAHVPLPQYTKAATKRFDWLPCAPPDLGKPLPSTPPITTQRLLVLWGMDRDNAALLGDAWILDLTSLTWEKYPLPPGLVPRTWHVSGAIHPSPDSAVVVSFSGAVTNLFDRDTIATNETARLEFGIPTLQRLCQQWLATTCRSTLSLLQPLLPTHLYQQILSIATCSQY